MRCALVLFGFAVLTTACAGAPSATHSPPAGSSPPSPRAWPDSALAQPSGCRAVPSTVYGDEPVVFEIDGAPAKVGVDVELQDLQGRALAKGRADLPGQWRPTDVPSGDFTLWVSPRRVRCMVTVNRELSRARPPEQK